MAYQAECLVEFERTINHLGTETKPNLNRQQWGILDKKRKFDLAFLYEWGRTVYRGKTQKWKKCWFFNGQVPT